MNRRAVLLAAVGSMTLLGVAAGSYVLLSSLAPAADKTARVLDVSLADIRPNSYKVVRWLTRPVAIFRTDSEVRVYYFLSTTSGCMLKDIPKGESPDDPEWPGGFMDFCRFGEWDYSGKALNRPGRSPKGEVVENLRAPNYDRISPDLIRLKMPT